MLFDGEEATDDSRPFTETGLRGSQGLRRAPRRRAQVADPARLRRRQGPADLPRGALRRRRCGTSCAPRPAGSARRPRSRAASASRHHRTTTCRSSSAACPAIDLIQWPYDCWHEPCDDLTQVEERSLDLTGETVYELDSYTQEEVTAAPEKLLLAAPRGYCAGVDRAVQTVERALELHGAPVYVRKEIVHNKHVVEDLAARGAIFVDELDGRDPRGRDHRLLRPRREPGRPRRRRGARAADDRRDLPARDQGAPRGDQVRRGRLHDRARRPRRPRGGRGHDGRGARRRWCSSRPRPTSTRSRSPIPSGSPTSRRPRSPSTRPARSSPGCARSSPRSPGRARTTSATRRPTASSPSARWPSSATSSS